jgi:hypothetical protein
LIRRPSGFISVFSFVDRTPIPLAVSGTIVVQLRPRSEDVLFHLEELVKETQGLAGDRPHDSVYRLKCALLASF